MKQVKQPTKEGLRNQPKQEMARPKPTPSLKQIRRELGWDLIEMRRTGMELYQSAAIT